MNRNQIDVDVFFARIKSYVDWRHQDATLVAAAWPIISPIVNDIVDDFYQSILKHDFTARIITGGQPQVERLKSTLKQWLASLFGGRYDDEFAATRWRVGRRHVEIGLNQAYAFAALTRLRINITQRLCSAWNGSSRDLCATVVAVNKLLDIDAAIIDFAYQQSLAAQLEETAEAKVKQIERLAAIGQMVTGLAHESRNILQRSHACLEALVLDIEDLPEAMKQAKRIHVALDRLHVLYEEVRNYAAPINLDRECVDLVNLVWRAWHSLETRWQPLAATMSMTCIQRHASVVNGDRHRFDQVITNLLQNAIDAAGLNGEIQCTISRSQDNRTCSICIEDSGPGIPSNQAARIFEPFFTTKTKGTGLGLAIANRIIDAHHGTITVDQSALGGAKITVFVPANDPPDCVT